MVQSIIQQNQIPNDPELGDAFNYFKKDIFLSLNCHHIGRIESFNAVNQTASVQINYKRTYFKPNSVGVVTPQLIDYPVIVDAPVIVLGGGGYSLTLPIEQGDECLILFNDKDIDAWFSGSNSSPNPTPRLHNFSDALCLVGLRSLPNVIANYESDGVSLRNQTGTIKVKVKDNGVDVLNGAVGVNVKSDGVDIVTGPTGVTGAFTNAGKFSYTNAQGEFLTALIQILQTATAAGFPLVLDPAQLAILQSFKV